MRAKRCDGRVETDLAGGMGGVGRFGLDLNNPDFVKYAER